MFLAVYKYLAISFIDSAHLKLMLTCSEAESYALNKSDS